MIESRKTAEFSCRRANGGNDPGDSELLAVGSPVRVGRLEDLRSLRSEAARLYREARRREGRYPDALTAQRLAGVLGAVRGYIEVIELETRLAALEAKQR